MIPARSDAIRRTLLMTAGGKALLAASPRSKREAYLRRRNAQEGHLETFRPYALPSQEWIEQAGKQLARLCGTATG